MTATSAHSANGTSSSPANPFARDLVASLRTVQLPGSPATYANRAVLRGLGLRWDPANHRWHGTTTAERVQELRERLGLEVRCFATLDAAPKRPTASRPAPTRPAPALAVSVAPDRGRERRPHDGSRTCLEARLAIPRLDADGDESEILTATRRFSVREITSGLPDDSREVDERAEELRLRSLRGCVKSARAVVSTTPGLAALLANDWNRAARFYERFGITEKMFRHGVPAVSAELPPRLEPGHDSCHLKSDERQSSGVQGIKIHCHQPEKLCPSP